jgi:hypothetical protein
METRMRKQLAKWAEELGIDVDDELREFDARDWLEKQLMYKEMRKDVRRARNDFRR